MTVSFWQSLLLKLLVGKSWWRQAMKYLRVCTTWIPRQLIKLYQYLLSPDHSKLGKYLYPCGYCKFYPSCSQYAYDVLEKYGLFWGGFRVVLRLFRCNPWHQGGIDLP